MLFECILLLMLIVIALASLLQKKLLTSVILYSGFGLVLSVVWMLLQAPDLAITEAAVGAGVTGVLFFLTLKKTDSMKENSDK